MNFWKMIAEWLKKIFNNVTTTTTTTSIPTPIPAGILKGYGMVNMWLDYSDFDGFMKLLKDNNCNCTSIELFGREEDGWINKESTVKSQFSKLLTAAKKYSITVFVDIVNQGSTSLTAKDDAWFQGYLDYFKTFEPSNLVIQAVGEGSGSKSEGWYRMMESTLSGFELSYNMGSRPTTASSKYKYIDYHSTTLTDLGSNDARIICNTDSGILNTMMNDGVLGQTFKTDQVTTFATGALNAGKSVNLYGYYHKTPDTAAIQTLGKVSVPGTTTTTTTTTATSSDLENLTNASWQGNFKGPNAKATIAASNLNVTSGSNKITLNFATHDWPYGDADCDSVICVAWITGGKKCAAYLDYCPRKRTTYTWDCLSNMANSSYSPKPAKGDACGFFILSQGLNERSNVVVSSIGWPL